jgi:Zn-dependent protease
MSGATGPRVYALLCRRYVVASPVVQRFPGLDQTTRWVPDRSFVSTSRVVLNVRNVRFHKDGLVVVGLVAVIIGLQIGGRVLALTKSSDDIGLVLACLMGWSISVLPFHHELAHATVARREGIEVVAAGYSAGRAYVLLQAPSTGVTVRAWTRTLVAGVVSNGVVALAAFAWWLGRGGAKVDPTGAFLLGVFAMELSTAIANSVPVINNDGRQLLQALRIARSPVAS